MRVDRVGGENAVVFTVRRKARCAAAPCNRDQRLGDTQQGIYGGVTAYHVYEIVITIVGTRDDATVVRHIDERNAYRDTVQCTVPRHRRRQRYRARMCAHGSTSLRLPPALPLNTAHCGSVLRVALDPQDAAVGGRRSGGAATTAANRNHRVAVCPPYTIIQQQQQQ